MLIFFHLQYTEIQKFTVNCATWNVNGQSAQEDVTVWLASDSEPPDLYAIGEIVGKGHN